jgi:chlorophyll synthase
MGVRSLPVQLGIVPAARSASWTMAVPQLVVIGLLSHWGLPGHAAVIAGLLIVQGVMMIWFVAEPSKRALYYSGFGVPLFVAGMMVSAFALRSLIAG